MGDPLCIERVGGTSQGQRLGGQLVISRPFRIYEELLPVCDRERRVGPHYSQVGSH
jgi:hypothetical protein